MNLVAIFVVDVVLEHGKKGQLMPHSAREVFGRSRHVPPVEVVTIDVYISQKIEKHLQGASRGPGHQSPHGDR